MVLYHYDRSGKLEPGTTISLNDNFPTDPDTQFLINAFPEGLSVHGNKYLTDIAYFFSSLPINIAERTLEFVQLTDILKARDTLSCHMIEFIFEMVRKASFSHLPSRLQSVFALESPSRLSEWPELLVPNGRTFEIEVPSNAIYRFDSYHLSSGIAYDVKDSPPNTHFLGFSYRLNFAAAMKYWDGQLTDTPRVEHLVPLPVQIGKEVSVSEKVLDI